MISWQRHSTLILGIGKPFEVFTQVHHAEDVLGDAFPVPRSRGHGLPITLLDGDLAIPFSLAGGGLQGRRDIGRLRSMLDRQQLREWKFHQVPFFATRASDVSEALIAAARRGLTLYRVS